MVNKISDVNDCDVLQSDLNMVYDWATNNSMSFNANKFQCISFSFLLSSSINAIYTSPSMDIIDFSSNVKDLGIYMSANCSFDYHIVMLSKRLNLTGWIMRTIVTRDSTTMLTLFKSSINTNVTHFRMNWDPYYYLSAMPRD